MLITGCTRELTIPKEIEDENAESYVLGDFIWMNRIRGNHLKQLAHAAWVSAVQYTKITYCFTSGAFFYISLLSANPTAIAKIGAENE